MFYKIKISAGSLLVLLVLMRIFIDVIWLIDKPSFVVLAYSAFCIFISLYFILYKIDRESIRKLVFLIFLFVSIFSSMFFSTVSNLKYITFSLQVFIPCLLLVSLTNSINVSQEAAKVFLRRFFWLVVVILFFSAYQNYYTNGGGEGFIEYYSNAPNHVLAQTLLKVSLPAFLLGFFPIVVLTAFIFILNVRSVILGYILSLVSIYYSSVFKKAFLKRIFIIGIPLVFVAVFYFDWSELVERLLFKDRLAYQGASLEALSSGRTLIYSFYINYIIENINFLKFLFGFGPVWLQESGPALSAHNDILNLFVSFGFVGLAGVVFAYYIFYKSLSKTGRRLFLFSFGVLFLTNGVVFHQSNILFLLLYAFDSEL